MEKKVAIVQSNYIPWKGYFDIINLVDEFVIYDEVQYTKNDWRNRNKIKTVQGVQWLTIPVKHTLSQKINETFVLNDIWRKKHWKTIQTNYSKAKFFNEYKDVFENLYLSNTDKQLSIINLTFIKAINNILNINTKISLSTDYQTIGDQTEKLVSLCKQTSASEYISGPAAKNYLNEKLFINENIKITWMNYSNYKEYSQLFSPFEHAVSIIDMIFNLGSDTSSYMNSFK